MSDKLERITGDSSIKKYFDTEYIGAYSIDDGIEPIVTIEGIWHGDLTLGGGRKEHHVILKFLEKRVPGVEEVKPMILNATNRKTLKKVYGDDSAKALEGKKIQLYIDPKVRDPQDGGFTEGLRIRPFKPKEQAATQISVKCADTGNEITATEKMTVAQIVAATKKKYGRPLCAERWMELVKQEKAAQDEPTTTDTEESEHAE